MKMLKIEKISYYIIFICIFYDLFFVRTVAMIKFKKNSSHHVSVVKSDILMHSELLQSKKVEPFWNRFYQGLLSLLIGEFENCVR